MDLRKWRHACVLAETRNFARGAEQLHITQSALSRSIQSLEKELDIMLFERRSTGVVVTPEGKEILHRAENLLHHAASLRRDVDLVRGGELGSLAFGAGPLPVSLLLPAALADLCAAYPALKVDVKVQPATQLLELLLTEKIEFLLADMSQIDPLAHIESEKLASFRMGLFVSRDHPLAQLETVGAEQVSPYLLAAPGFKEGFSPGGEPFVSSLRWNGLLTCESPRVLNAIALQARAVLLSSHSIVAKELEEGVLVPLNFDGADNIWHSDLRIVRLSGRRLSPVAELVLQAIKRHVAEEDRPRPR